MNPHPQGHFQFLHFRPRDILLVHLAPPATRYRIAGDLRLLILPEVFGEVAGEVPDFLHVVRLGIVFPRE